jgi:hypothetical protein
MKGFLVTLGVLIVLGIGIAIWAVGLSNEERRLRNRADAVQESNEAFFGKMWEILRDQAGVVEQNPTFDTSLYQRLMASIEAQREGFLYRTTKIN